MYPNELKQYIRDRNGELTSEETAFVTDINFHPQLNHITYNSWDASYDMWDCEGNYYHFRTIESR